MRYWTWAEIRSKIEAECDLEDEDFIRADELLGYANEAIDEAEADIHTLYEDYFLSFKDISIAAQDQYISVPTNIPDIYAGKIRKIEFTSGGGQTYPVRRLKDGVKFDEKALSDAQITSDVLHYFPINRTVGTPELLLVPKASEAGTMKVWYLRNANRLVVDTDVCDIPEFINFIFAYMKVKVFAKEGHPGYDGALERLENERLKMTGTLQAQTPDADNELETDTSYYTDMN